MVVAAPDILVPSEGLGGGRNEVGAVACALSGDGSSERVVCWIFVQDPCGAN
jgi:hypothetical protein